MFPKMCLFSSPTRGEMIEFDEQDNKTDQFAEEFVSCPHLPVPYIFGTKGRLLPDILACLGATGSKYIGGTGR